MRLVLADPARAFRTIAVPRPMEVDGALPVLAVLTHALAHRRQLPVVLVDGAEPDRAHPLVLGIEPAAARTIDQPPVHAVTHEVPGGDDVTCVAVPYARQRVREEHLVGVLRPEDVPDAERAVRRTRRLRGIMRR